MQNVQDAHTVHTVFCVAGLIKSLIHLSKVADNLQWSQTMKQIQCHHTNYYSFN